jgi:hypothetical protein
MVSNKKAANFSLVRTAEHPFTSVSYLFLMPNCHCQARKILELSSAELQKAPAFIDLCPVDRHLLPFMRGKALIMIGRF